MSLQRELIAHLILVGFAGYVIVSADPGSSLFSWHPTCMVLAWLLFTEGVLLFRKPSLGWRVAIHWAFQATGMTLALGGFYAIYQNKEGSRKAHFTTYHGLCGVITLGLLTVQAVGGNIANYSVALSRKFRFIRPGQIKGGHRLAGALSLTLVTTTVFLALFSLWFQAVTHSVLWWGIATLIVYPLVHTLKITYF